MKAGIPDKLKFIAAGLVLVIIIGGCGIFRGFFGTDRLYFCESYDAVNDLCVGEGKKFTIGSLTVMADLKQPIGVDEVYINVKDNATGQTVNNFPFTVTADMDYINFKGVTFTSPGNYKVSLIKKDGAVIASNELEITD